MYSRDPSRFSLPGFGGVFGHPPRDLLIVLGVLFATFALQFFESTAIIPALLRLTPAVIQQGFVWQLATYPFVGFGQPGLGFLIELLVLFFFGRDVYLALGRRKFWRLIAWAAIPAGVAAVVVHLGASVVNGGAANPFTAPFALMQGQRMLLAITAAAFARLAGDATIYLFFILPIPARWLIGFELLIAFMGFLSLKDLGGLVGIVVAIAVVVWRLDGRGRRGSGGSGKRKIGFFREMRLRAEKRILETKLERERKKRGMRIVRGGEGGRGSRDEPPVN